MSELDYFVAVGDRAYKESEILEWKSKAEKYDEAEKKCEELEAKVMQYESLRLEDVLAFEGSKGKLTNADYKCLYINTLKHIEELEHKCKTFEHKATLWDKANNMNSHFEKVIVDRSFIEELQRLEKEQRDKNKVLVEGVRALKYGNDIDFDFNEKGKSYFMFNDTWFSCSIKDLSKIKAMLELVEVEE